MPSGGSAPPAPNLWITSRIDAVGTYNLAAPKTVFHKMTADLWLRGC